MRSSLISIQNVIADYGNFPVIRNLNFKLSEGELIFLLGNNGAGKSTFLKLLNAELKPTQGAILLNEEPITKLNFKEKAKFIASLPQYLSLEFDMEVFDVVLSGAFNRTNTFGNYSKEELNRAEEILKAFNLSALKNRLMSTLSGGEKQMVFLATIEMQNTQILLLDEPSQHLDLYYKKKLFEQIQNWHQKGKTLLVSTHDVAYLKNIIKATILYFEKGNSPIATPLDTESLNFYIKKMEEGF